MAHIEANMDPSFVVASLTVATRSILVENSCMVLSNSLRLLAKFSISLENISNWRATVTLQNNKMSSSDIENLASSLRELESTMQEFSTRIERVATVSDATTKLGSMFASMFDGMQNTVDQTSAESKEATG